MKTNWIASLLVAVAAISIFSAKLHSQSPGDKTPLQTAYGLRDKNKEILDKQAATLQKLDELSKAVSQLKAFGKRT